MFRYIVGALLPLFVATHALAATSTYDRFVGNHAKFGNTTTASLVVTGVAKVPTKAAGDNSTNAATTAYTDAAASVAVASRAYSGAAVTHFIGTNGFASLSAAVTSLGATPATLQYKTDQTLTANITIPSTLELLPLNGAVINHGAYTISYAGSTERWPLARIFNGTGAVTGFNRVLLEWFGGGASAAAATNTSAATKAFAASATGGTLELLGGTYTVSRALQIPSSWALKGVGRNATRIARSDTTIETLDGGPVLSTLYVKGTWVTIEDLTIDGNDAVNAITFSNSGPPSHFNISRVDINHCLYAFTETQGLFMSTFNNVNVAYCQYAFSFTSSNGKTSLTFNSCYASSCGQAWDFYKLEYGVLNSCGADWCNGGALLTATTGGVYGNPATVKGVYHFEFSNVTLNGCGTESQSYGNGSIGSVGSFLTVNNFTSFSGRSTYTPDYATYTNYAVGPLQTGTGFANITINGMNVVDWHNTVVDASYPSKPVASLVAFNYDEAANGVHAFTMVYVGPNNAAASTMFAGNGNYWKYCHSVYADTHRPAFSAYASVNQALTTATFTKVSVNTEEFDTAAAFDAATYKFQPTTPGYYQISGAVQTTGTISRSFCTLYKNGAEFKRGTDVTAGVNQSTVSALVYFNGTTDYAELYVYAVGTGLSTAAGTSQFSYFQGAFNRGI